MLRRTLALTVSAVVGLPASVALLPAQASPVPDLTVAPVRAVDSVVLTGEAFGTWSVPSNVTAKAPLTDLRDCQSFDEKCRHNSHSEPEVDSSRVAAPAGTDVTKLTGWRWDPASKRFVEVPFQVDEVFTRYLNNSASGFSVYSGEDQHTSYAFQREGFRFTKSDPSNPCLAVADSPTAKDPIKGLDTNDEVVFMARDAGPQAPADAKRPHGTTGVKAVAVADPITRTTSYLYVMQGLAPTFNAKNGYVRYTRDANADTFEKSESSYDNYGNAARGTYCDDEGNVVMKADGVTPDVQRRRPRDTATIETDRYQYRYDGRWLMTSVKVKDDAATTYGADLVDRWKARAFQQDAESETPCCGYEEEDTNWGGSSTLHGELSGPVRTVRETWGADSGTNVIRRETFYRDDMVMKTWLRVHVIPPLDGIYSQWDYNAGVMTKYYNPNVPQGVAVDGKNDEVLGNFDDPCNAKYDANGTGSVTQTYRDLYKQTGACERLPYHQSFDVTDPTMSKPGATLDWSLTAGPNGSIVDRYYIEPNGQTPGGLAQGVVAVPYYRDDSCFDDATGTNPGPRLKLRSAGEPQTLPDGTKRRCWTPADGVVDNDPTFFQGDIGAHGVHLLFLADSDNGRMTVPVNEIVSSHRQVFLTGERNGAVGEQYGRGFEKPLVATASDASFAERPADPPAKKQTTLDYDGDDMAGPQKAVRLSATLTEPDNAPVVGATVTFTFGDDPPVTATTDSSGRAMAEASYPKGNAREVPVKVEYAGDDTRTASSDTATVRRKE